MAARMGVANSGEAISALTPRNDISGTASATWPIQMANLMPILSMGQFNQTRMRSPDGLSCPHPDRLTANVNGIVGPRRNGPLPAEKGDCAGGIT